MNLFLNIFRSTLGFYIQATTNPLLSESERPEEGCYRLVIQNYIGGDIQKTLKFISTKIQDNWNLTHSEICTEGDISRISFYGATPTDIKAVVDDLRRLAIASTETDVLTD